MPRSRGSIPETHQCRKRTSPFRRPAPLISSARSKSRDRLAELRQSNNDSSCLLVSPSSMEYSAAFCNRLPFTYFVLIISLLFSATQIQQKILHRLVELFRLIHKKRHAHRPRIHHSNSKLPSASPPRANESRSRLPRTPSSAYRSSVARTDNPPRTAPQAGHHRIAELGTLSRSGDHARQLNLWVRGFSVNFTFRTKSSVVFSAGLPSTRCSPTSGVSKPRPQALSSCRCHQHQARHIRPN